MFHSPITFHIPASPSLSHVGSWALTSPLSGPWGLIPLNCSSPAIKWPSSQQALWEEASRGKQPPRGAMSAALAWGDHWGSHGQKGSQAASHRVGAGSLHLPPLLQKDSARMCEPSLPPRLCWGQWLSRSTLPAEDCGWGFRLARAGAEESGARKGALGETESSPQPVGEAKACGGTKGHEGRTVVWTRNRRKEHRPPQTQREGQKRCEWKRSFTESNPTG